MLAPWWWFLTEVAHGREELRAGRRSEPARSWRTSLCALGVLVFRFEERINIKEEFSLEVGIAFQPQTVLDPTG
jgi:hypothetical protein